MSQEIAIIATNARPIGPNMTYVREETITVSEPCLLYTARCV